MDAQTIIELARRAQTAGQSLEAFVQDSLRRGRGPADPLPPLLQGSPGAPGPKLTTPLGGAGRPANLQPAAVAGAAAQLLQRLELSADFWPALAGSRVGVPPERQAEVIRQFLLALAEVWRPSPSNVLAAFLRNPVLARSEEELAYYRVLLTCTLVQVSGVNPEALVRQALPMAMRAEQAAECARTWGILNAVASVVVAVAVAVVVTAYNFTARDWLGVTRLVGTAIDGAIIPAIVLTIKGGIKLQEIAVGLTASLKLSAARSATLIASSWKLAGTTAAGSLDSLVAVLQFLHARETAQAQEVLRKVAAELLRLQLDLGQLMQSLRSLQGAGETDIVRALRANGVDAANIARAMKAAGKSFNDVARALFDSGFPSDQARALATAFNHSLTVVQGMLRALGL